MQGGTDRGNILEAEITNFVQSEFRVMALQQHLKEIIEDPAFKGSHRSGQFLQYIVDQSIAGRIELLKERLIGVELFGRSPSYDTGEDAIVPVTASSRLTQRPIRDASALVHEGRLSEPRRCNCLPRPGKQHGLLISALPSSRRRAGKR